MLLRFSMDSTLCVICSTLILGKRLFVFLFFYVHFLFSLLEFQQTVILWNSKYCNALDWTAIIWTVLKCSALQCTALDTVLSYVEVPRKPFIWENTVKQVFWGLISGFYFFGIWIFIGCLYFYQRVWKKVHTIAK